jgi:hypothetical protein
MTKKRAKEILTTYIEVFERTQKIDGPLVSPFYEIYRVEINPNAGNPPCSCQPKMWVSIIQGAKQFCENILNSK